MERLWGSVYVNKEGGMFVSAGGMFGQEKECFVRRGNFLCQQQGECVCLESGGKMFVSAGGMCVSGEEMFVSGVGMFGSGGEMFGTGGENAAVIYSKRWLRVFSVKKVIEIS